jgi:cyclopropane fatty-acyl-phospholipid synthase-like methyltransferase
MGNIIKKFLAFDINSESDFTLIGQQLRVPENVSQLSTTPNLESPGSKIDFLWSQSINHLMITNFNPPEYYEDYFMTTSYSEEMQQLQQNQCSKIFSLTKEYNSNDFLSLVEIGCGDGSFLKYAEKLFDEVIGIEPSKSFAVEASKLGLSILNEYVTSSKNIGLSGKNAFVARQVFEHLPDPLDCLITIYSMLSEGAIGLIEVPNGYGAFRKGNFYEFFPDHIHYYSINSLIALASSANFNVIECKESFNGDYLELWVRKDSNQIDWIQPMIKKSKDLLNTIKLWMSTLTLNDEVVLFGVGAKTISIIGQDPKFFNDHFKFAIDSDPNKFGKYIPNTGIKVIGLDSKNISRANKFLILALSYKSEISKMIRSQFGESVGIFTIDDHGFIINIQNTN